MVRNDPDSPPVRASAVRQAGSTYTATGWVVHPPGLTPEGVSSKVTWPMATRSMMGPLSSGRSERGRGGPLSYSSICLAMISFMISEVPPPMVMRRMSRKNRSTGYSRM